MTLIKSSAKIIGSLFLFGLAACGGSSSSSSTNTEPTPYNGPVGFNVMEVTVNGSLCDPNHQYFNEPCTSVTICSPGTKNCQTINNILVDTGSYGLRIFNSAITIPLNQLVDSSNNAIAECATFGTGADWGPVKYADVQMGTVSLGGELAPNVPIQVIDSTFQDISAHPSWCSNGQIDTSPAEANFNGILGVGVFAQDCGTDCDPTLGDDVNNGMYFSCANNNCSSTTLALANQVTNPVASLPTDNNGILLSLPSVNQGGNGPVAGALILGVGTQANNQPGASVQTIRANDEGEFTTAFNGKTSPAILDSGTNTYSFDDSSIPSCSGADSDFYCPAAEIQLSATQKSYLTNVTKNASFFVANTDNYPNQDAVFNDIGDKMGDNGAFFIWGIPFFYGQSIFVGIDTKSSSLSSGPYWAY
jgi:hypothetical protein